MKFSVKLVSDTKIWDKMERRLLKGDKTIQTGWWGDRNDEGIFQAQIAAWNEEGHVNGGMFAGTYTPPRPFIRNGFIPHAKKQIKNYYPVIHDIAMGRNTWSSLYHQMGKDWVELLQSTILSWSTPPNSPVTISLKGFNDPLIYSGGMYDSVKYRITRRTQ